MAARTLYCPHQDCGQTWRFDPPSLIDHLTAWHRLNILDAANQLAVARWRRTDAERDPTLLGRRT